MRWVGDKLLRWLVQYLTAPSARYEPFSLLEPNALAACLRPGDVLLVEGDQRFSVAVKYLTQSTWSHAALFVGDAVGTSGSGTGENVLVEADLEHGVMAVPLSKYRGFNTRICRPVGLTADDRERVLKFVLDRIGMAYDLQNVIDLLRYLLPTPPVPVRWRRRMLALGSGEPTRTICSSMIASAFQSVKYPILPVVERPTGSSSYVEREILHIRHHSLFTPRDFDVSPYFRVVKPTIEQGFDYRELEWD